MILQIRLTRFAPACGETDGASCAHRGQFRHYIQCGMAVHTNEGGIRGCGKLGKAAMAWHARDAVPRGMHGPERSVKPHPAALLDHIGRPSRAQHGDGTGAQQASEGRHVQNPAQSDRPGRALPSPDPTRDI